MRRAFFSLMIAGEIVFLFGGHRGFAANPPETQADLDGIAGEWSLLRATDNEMVVPQHRMDLRFWNESGELKGAILSQRNDGTEMPLATSEFDGSTLRFKMKAPSGKSQAEMPTMVMTRSGGNFEGYWADRSGAKIGPKLKLVRPVI